MVRSLAQWTKSLSFPSRLSPNRSSKDCSGVNIHQVNPPPPTPPRNSKSSSTNSSSPSPTHNNNNNNNVPITEINQIVSDFFFITRFFTNSSFYYVFVTTWLKFSWIYITFFPIFFKKFWENHILTNLSFDNVFVTI